MQIMAALENRFLAFLHGRARPAGAEDWPTPKFMSNLQPFTRKKIQEQLGRWSWTDLARALTALEEAHLTLISSGDHPPRMLLENLALGLAALGRSGR
jgi:DNA polymerase III delta subunit